METIGSGSRTSAASQSASGDVGAVAFEQQEAPGGDVLVTSAGLLSVIVEMEFAVDRIAKKPDSMAFALGELIQGAGIVREAGMDPELPDPGNGSHRR